MALLFADGFDKYSSFADIGFRLQAASNMNFSTGRWGGGAAVVTAVNTRINTMQVAFPPLAAGNAIHMAAHVYLNGAMHTSNNYYWFGFTTLSSTYGIGLYGGVPYAFKNGAPTVNIGNVSPNPFAATTWGHMEMAFLAHQTSGYVKFWYEGELLVDYTGQTSTITVDDTVLFYICDCTNFNGMRLDDLVIWNELGGEFDMAQLGRHRISTLTPSGAGTHADFTPSSGANYAAVDDSTFHDSDTTYVESSTVGDIDSYAVGALSYNPADIYGVQVSTRVKDFGSLQEVQGLVRSSGTEGLGISRVTRSNYYQNVALFVEDPHTAAAWTPAAVNAMEIGFKHSA